MYCGRYQTPRITFKKASIQRTDLFWVWMYPVHHNQMPNMPGILTNQRYSNGACFYILKRSVVMLKLESSGFAAASAMPYRRRHSNSRSRLLKKIVNKAPLNTMGSLLSVILPILQRIWLVKMGNKNALKALLCVQMTQNHNGSGQVAQMFVFVQK